MQFLPTRNTHGKLTAYARREIPITIVTRKTTRKRKNSSFANPAEAAATPVKPKIAARIATSKNASAQFIITDSLSEYSWGESPVNLPGSPADTGSTRPANGVSY